MAVTVRLADQYEDNPLKNSDFNELAALANTNETNIATNTTSVSNVVDGTTAFTGIHYLTANDLASGAGAGISGVAETYGSSVMRIGSVYVTRIVIDLTGLNSGGTAADIIGDDATANCHIGQYTAAESGTIWGGRMICYEVPTGGEPNIDLFAADEATGTEDTAITALTNDTALLESSGDWTLNLSQALTAVPAANQYLYLVAGDATDNTYTAGRFMIELFGVA